MKAIIILVMLIAVAMSGCTENPDNSGSAGRNPPDAMENFRDRNNSIDDATMEEVDRVFNLNEDIESYCLENMFACGYYCRTSNPEHEFCLRLRQLGNNTERRRFNGTNPMRF